MMNYLLIVTIVIFACVFLSRVSNRLGIPTLLFFILLGMVFGSDGILKIPFDNYAFAEQTCSIALIFIMIQRGEQIIIPNGNVRLEAGDLLVINRSVN